MNDKLKQLSWYNFFSPTIWSILIGNIFRVMEGIERKEKKMQVRIGVTDKLLGEFGYVLI